MLIRKCSAINERGQPCGQAPLVGGAFCYWHEPENQDHAAEVRRLGGQNRKREMTLRGVYEVEGLDGIQPIRRILDIAILGALSQENSLNRSRVLIAGVLAAVKLLEVGEQEERLAAIEAALGPRAISPTKRR